MKKLLIIGASGLGRGTYDLALQAFGYGTNFQIKGFLDFNIHALDAYPEYPAVISSEDDYQIKKDDVFVCAIGNVHGKKRCVEKMLARGAEFYTLIHEKANISPHAHIGAGSIIQPGACIDTGVTIGNHCLIQSYAIVGHDAQIGNYTRIDCFVMCVGGIMVKDGATIHTSAVINHNVKIGEGSTVGACSFVIRNVKDHTTVMGNPAKELKF